MREEIFIEVRDIAEARRFYRNVVGCSEGPSAEQELNLILHGQKIVCGLNPTLGRQGKLPSHYNPRTGRFVPDTRYAVALETEQWSALAERLRHGHTEFKIAPGERATLLLLDPSGNALEFTSSPVIADQFLRRERRRVAWASWAIVTALILCWIGVITWKPANELRNPLPPCASKASCAP